MENPAGDTVTGSGSAAIRVFLLDDLGVGIGDRSPTGRGLANMQARAVRLGGTVAIDAVVSGGTDLRWSVPLGPNA